MIDRKADIMSRLAVHYPGLFASAIWIQSDRTAPHNDRKGGVCVGRWMDGWTLCMFY